MKLSISTWLGYPRVERYTINTHVYDALDKGFFLVTLPRGWNVPRALDLSLEIEGIKVDRVLGQDPIARVEYFLPDGTNANPHQKG